VKLKSLHIKGFKSFANETNIHFREEITGIVGPNGSGKSNIIDAIRWVLGEQRSKGLRLDKMIDVIFNGTKNKKKASLAQVSMTFENSNKLIPIEFEEVKVTRMLYNTNESEYRINDVPCRLKDITNLFLNTGIGSNSYAIIELGMVDDILLDKDHARRKMFEQAAGISKYKIRKHETLNKLKSTQADLDRIEDILFELEANLKTLERQAKRTQKYYDLKTEYKELSVNKAYIGQKEALAQEAELKSQLLIFNEKYNETSKIIHELEADVEANKKANLDSEQALSAKQKEYNEVVDALRTKENELEIKKQNVEFVLQNISRFTNNKKQFSEASTDISRIIETKKKELSEKEIDKPRLESELEASKAEFERVEVERQKVQGENNTDVDRLKALENKKFELEKDIISLKSKSDNSEQNSIAISNDLVNFQSIQGNLSSQQDTIATELTKVTEEYDKLVDQSNNIEKERAELTETLTVETDKLSKLERRYDALSSEYNLLKDMVDNFEGFPESAKFLATEWEEKRPILSDVLDCDAEYREAIELYLEPYLGYFILDTIHEAKESIRLLREAQKGKSQFFILSSFLDTKTHELNLSQHGSAAINVVRTKPKYEALLHHLLYNVVLIEDDRILSEIMPDDNLIYLSKSGHANRSKYTVSGGSVGLFDGKRIGRKHEVEKLKKQIEEIASEVEEQKNINDSISNKLSHLNQEDIQQAIVQKRNIKNNLEIKKAEMGSKYSSLHASIEDLSAKLQLLDSGKSEAAIEIANLSEDLAKLNVEIESQSNIVNDQSGLLDSITQNYGDISSRYNDAQLNIVKYHNEIDSIQKEIQFREQQIKEYTTKIEEVDVEIAKAKENEKQSNLQIEEINKSLYDQYKLRDTKQSELTTTEQGFFANRNVINEKEELLKKRNKELQNQQIEINQHKDKLTSVEFELHSVKERLKIEFNIDIVELKVEFDSEDEQAIETLNTRYAKVKKRLDNYGEINPMAVEAYDEINERYMSMKTQRDDILEAEESLKLTIKEIDNDATEKFLEAFYLVKDNFKDVFRSLFSDEDDCDLILLNAESPLDSQIEIVAKPKGKKPKVLSQLSGGEKTLTAIALLFSLYLLKPAPFCIFDEVDAPLDDVNIVKFASLIKKFSNNSQFIVVTHNKSTMAGMDTLYGVYMQEQGVSGISQVDFRDYDHQEVYQTVNV
jgi:chromosome segregation protein